MKPDVYVLPHANSKSPLTHYAISLAPKQSLSDLDVG